MTAPGPSVSTSTEERVQFSGSEVVTPRARSVARRWVFWLIVVVILVLIGLITFAAAGSGSDANDLSATNPGANGAEALVQVLRQDNVTVYTADTFKATTRDAGGKSNSTTIAIYDPNDYLGSTQLKELPTLAANIVLIAPSPHELRALAPGLMQAGAVEYTAKAGCSYGPAKRAGTVSGLSQGYEYYGSDSNVQRCLGSDSAYSLIRVRDPLYTVTVLGSIDPLTNQTIPLNGNAALALGMFGSTDHLIWYRPSFADLPSTTPDGAIPPPPWLSPLILLAGLVVVAAALWRGRRLGRVVVERMPVSVRSSETLEGRARLYQKASVRSHALDGLRVGTLTRLAKKCGLGRRANVDEIVGRVASLTGRDASAVRSLLVDAMPMNDLQLVHLSDELRELENDVSKAVANA